MKRRIIFVVLFHFVLGTSDSHLSFTCVLFVLLWTFGLILTVFPVLVSSGGSRKFWWGGIWSTKPQKFGCLHQNWDWFFGRNRKFKRIFRPNSGGLQKKKKRSSPKLRLIFRPKSEIQTFFSPKFRWSPKKKKKRSSPKLRLLFRPKPEIQTFFSPKFRWSPKKKKKKKKKKVFTKIETDFSPDSLRLGRWGGMHPEMEPIYSKQRLIFRPKSLLLGWWGGMHPPP